MSQPTFITNEVTLFLAKRYPYCATCFGQDMVKHGDTVSELIVEKWLRRYFPAESAYNVWRALKNNVSQTNTEA